MSRYYLFTTVAGIVVLDESMRLIPPETFPGVGDLPLTKHDPASTNWSPEEGAMTAAIRKSDPEAQIVFIGRRSGDPPQGAAYSEDVELRGRIAHALSGVAGLLEELQRANLDETKGGIKAAFTQDQMIIGCIRLIDDLNKTMSLLGKRFREWFALAHPDSAHLIPNDERLIELALGEDWPEELMGAEISSEDAQHLRYVAQSLMELIAFRQAQVQYLETRMEALCPNVVAVAGARIGGKLISKAGSLERLAVLPSSTVQMLGAEQALFRHLKNRNASPPKYGILHEHPAILAAPKRNHGKIARLLADKISLAARVDYFKGQYIGDRLAKEVESRIGVISSGRAKQPAE